MSLPLELQFDLSQEKWEAVRANFSSHGINVPDDEAGEISQSGVIVAFKREGSMVYLTVIKKPFFVTEDYVINSLTEFIAQS